jgi:hypothetical protein
MNAKPIYNYLEKSGWQLIFFNVIVLVFVKLVLFSPGLQFASLLNPVSDFSDNDIVSITNNARVSSGLKPLSANASLNIAAQEKLRHMADNNYFAHISPTGISPWFWIKKNDYGYTYAGENLAVGFNNASDIVNAWLDSPSHRANLLSSKYKEIGVAIGQTSIDGASGIIVVQMFGSPTGSVETIPALPPTATLQPKVNPLMTKNPISPSVVAAVTDTAPSEEKEPHTQLQYVSTDNDILPVANVKEVFTETIGQTNKRHRLVNDIYIFYALFISVISVMFLLVVGRRRGAVARAVLDIVILFLALYLPTIGLSIKGLIY